jgi:hypothetical protein
MQDRRNIESWFMVLGSWFMVLGSSVVHAIAKNKEQRTKN